MIKATSLVALAALALSPLVGVGTAEAGGRGKDYYTQDYFFKRKMNGYEGFSGAYYCSHQSVPVRTRNAAGQIVTVWKLTQSCQ